MVNLKIIGTHMQESTSVRSEQFGKRPANWWATVPCGPPHACGLIENGEQSEIGIQGNFSGWHISKINWDFHERGSLSGRTPLRLHLRTCCVAIRADCRQTQSFGILKHERIEMAMSWQMIKIRFSTLVAALRRTIHTFHKCLHTCCLVVHFSTKLLQELAHLRDCVKSVCIV